MTTVWRQRVAIVSCLILASACNPGSGAPGNADINTAAASYAARLEGMSDLERKAEFAAAARGAGETCGQITGTTAPRPADGATIWTVQCGADGELAMIIAADRIGRVLRTRPPTPRPAADPCARLVGNWTNGRDAISVARDGPNYLINYRYYSARFQYAGPCEQGRVITNSDWVGDLAYMQSSDTVIFQRNTFTRLR